MKIEANSPEEYIQNLEPERKKALQKLRDIFNNSLPNGFEEEMSYGMIGYVVPKSLYPSGYHVDPKLPLPFINIASQKNFIAIYHMGIYALPDLLKWFKEEYGRRVPTKLDMGKSCIRLKNPDKIPFDLIEELAKKMSPQDWIKVYEDQMKNK